MGWRGRGMYGPWPGRGPFSNLPPWQRPGWLYGRGACWRFFGPGYPPLYPSWNPPNVADQIEDLEDYKKEVEAELADIDREIERIKKEIEGKTEKK
ncbi:DUF5320 domain-containing protein [[Eubacterium] cellulosolvens]